MTYTTDTSLRGTTTITADQAIAIATARGAKGNYVAYIRELWNLCERYGLNADVLFAQWLEETNNGSSDLWLEGIRSGSGSSDQVPRIRYRTSPERSRLGYTSPRCC